MYQELLGRQLFLKNSIQPELSASIGILCRYTASPTEIHWNALKMVLRYLKGTIDLAFQIREEGEIILSGYCDADWCGVNIDRRSTTLFTLQLGNTPVIWRILKQKSVDLLTTEAEFSALIAATKTVVWIRHLLNELRYQQNEATIISEENQGVFSWVEE